MYARHVHRFSVRLYYSLLPVRKLADDTLPPFFRMSSVNLVVIVESVRIIISHTNGETTKFHLPSLLAVGAALGVKFVLFLYCYTLRTSSNPVRVLWQDHRNDLFVNSFGILMSAGGSRLRWCSYFHDILVAPIQSSGH
jgi:hypothetical protein